MELNRSKISTAIIVPTFIMGLIWLVQFIQVIFPDYPFYKFGVQPRTLSGIVGVVSGPLVHNASSFDHILANSIPFFVLCFFTFFWYYKIAWKVFTWIWLVTGLWVWVFAVSGGYHIGISGIIYGLLAFLFVSGVVRWNMQAMAISLLVAFLYGSLFWGIFPLQQGVSWESHFLGAVAGMVIAIYYKKENIFKRHQYDWENEDEDDRNYHHTSNKSFTFQYHYKEKK